MTDLDNAHAAMLADEGSDTLRLQFFERLADTELFLLLTKEPDGDHVDPEVFEVEDQSFVLVFDRPERLTEFTGAISPYAAMSGRMLSQLLTGQGIGLGLNLDVAPSSMLIPPEALSWLVDTLQNGPAEEQDRISEIASPVGLPEQLIQGLDRKLATARGLARSAYLVKVTYEAGRNGHLLAIVDAIPGAEDALASAIGEALTFSGIEAGSLDVSFFKSTEEVTAKFAQYGLRFDLPQPEAAHVPGAPGMDPDMPPKLV